MIPSHFKHSQTEVRVISVLSLWSLSALVVIRITTQLWLLKTGMQGVGIQLAGDNQTRLAFGS